MHIQENFDLTSLNTFRVSAKAKYYVRVQSKDELKKTTFEFCDQTIFVLGGGSNVLFVNDFEGLIIHPEIKGKQVVNEDSNQVWLKVGAGENWHELVRYCVQKGWGGIENLSLIPGWAGAAPIQNIGAYGIEFEEVFHSLTAIEIATGKSTVFFKEDCHFSYRDSIFKRELKNKYVITDVTICLNKEPKVNISYGSIQGVLNEKGIKDPSIHDISDIVIKIRNSKLPDPAIIPNAGSFFKNPVITNNFFEELKNRFPEIPHYLVDENHTKIPAGWLIEKTGWKGKERGKAGVYHQQALVIINKGGATGRQILDLANDIQQSVSTMFGITLVPEVNVIDNADH